MAAVGSASMMSRLTAKRNIWRISEKISFAMRVTPRARRASVTAVTWPLRTSSTASAPMSGRIVLFEHAADFLAAILAADEFHSGPALEQVGDRDPGLEGIGLDDSEPAPWRRLRPARLFP